MFTYDNSIEVWGIGRKVKNSRNLNLKQKLYKTVQLGYINLN